MVDLMVDDEEALAVGATTGDRGALDTLLRRYEPHVHRLCRQMIAHEAEAADISQEIFLRVVREIGQFDPTRSFRVWLYTLARNVVVDHLRRRGKWWDIEKDLVRQTSASRSQGDPVLRAESEEHLRRALALLPEPYRLVLFYTAWEELRPAEIAHILDMPAGRVRVHLFRALKLLEKKLNAL